MILIANIFTNVLTRGVVAKFTFPPKMWTRGREFHTRSFFTAREKYVEKLSFPKIYISIEKDFKLDYSLLLGYFALSHIICYYLKQIKVIIVLKFTNINVYFHYILNNKNSRDLCAGLKMRKKLTEKLLSYPVS